VGALTPTATRLTSLGGYTPPSELHSSPPPEALSGQEYAVPPLAAHQELIVTFLASYNTPEDAIIGGSVRLKNLGTATAPASSKGYAPSASVRPGDNLGVAAHLDNAGWRSSSAHVRAVLRRRDGGRYYDIVVYVHQPWEPEHMLDSSIVNSATGQPISLQIEPGTTELRPARTKCTTTVPRKLDDGIAEGGVEVSPIGGFVARDPCQGLEFTRWVIFTVAIH
jgi:hypothetical protein